MSTDLKNHKNLKMTLISNGDLKNLGMTFLMTDEKFSVLFAKGNGKEASYSYAYFTKFPPLGLWPRSELINFDSYGSFETWKNEKEINLRSKSEAV